jgi:hypothetical protein
LPFCEYELEELNHLVRMSGVLPRSSLVNIALEHLLHDAKELDFQMCKKRGVNLIIDQDKFNRLMHYAKSHGVQRTGLIRLATRNFKMKQATEDKRGGNNA